MTVYDLIELLDGLPDATKVRVAPGLTPVGIEYDEEEKVVIIMTAESDEDGLWDDHWDDDVVEEDL
jgi:hypothetical protein